MKRNVISTVILAVAAMLAVGCTPENVAPEPQPTVTTRNVSYVKCGDPGHATVTGDEAWHALLDTLFDAVDEGCEVSFWDAADGEGEPTKESVTYRTASRDSAYAWGERMYDQGYTVSVIFDPDSGQYVCSAVKTTSDPERYTFNVGWARCGIVASNLIAEYSVWCNLLDEQFDAVDEGCIAAIWNADFIPDTSQTKTCIIYRTPLRDSAYSWIETMFAHNYFILLLFDTYENVYTLTAKEMTTPPVYYHILTGLALVVGEEVPLVINSQAEFDSLLPYSVLPYNNVDFNTQSLICAWGQVPNWISSQEANVEYDGNDVIVTVDIKMSILMCAPTWWIAIPCNKITDDQNVILIVNKELITNKK